MKSRKVDIRFNWPIISFLMEPSHQTLDSIQKQATPLHSTPSGLASPRLRLLCRLPNDYSNTLYCASSHNNIWNGANKPSSLKLYITGISKMPGAWNADCGYTTHKRLGAFLDLKEQKPTEKWLKFNI